MPENANSLKIEDILSEIDILENVLNGDMLSKYMDLHNISGDYGIIKMKQELVASDACFLNKKIYGLYITNKEKKPVDEFEIRGMIMRKSNFPEYSKKRMETLLDMILRTEYLDLEEIQNFVEEGRSQAIKLCSEGAHSIAGSVSYNKDMDAYKIVPSHVKAMELWNSLEYSYFVPGTKGYLFRILGVDPMTAPEKVLNASKSMTVKNKSIVVPFEEDRLPEYYILNTQAQMEYCWESRIREIMSVFGANVEFSMDALMEDHMRGGFWSAESELSKDEVFDEV